MPVIEENTGFIYCVEVNLYDVVVIRLVGLHSQGRCASWVILSCSMVAYT